MHKFLFLIFIIVYLKPFDTHSRDVIRHFLETVAKNSDQFQIISLEKKIDDQKSEIPFSEFDLTGFLGIDYTDSKDIPLSPFSPESTNRTVFSSGITKFWENGLETSMAYSLTDNLTKFPSRENSDFISPDFSIRLKTNLFQDFIGERAKNVSERAELDKKSSRLNERIKKKALLVEALLSLTNLLELEEELSLQKNLCKKIGAQKKKLKSKMVRNSISKRDYLLSRKDFESCMVSVKSLLKKSNSLKEDLKVKFGINNNFLSKTSVKSLFTDFTTIYGEFSDKSVNLELSSLELISLKNDRERLLVEEKDSIAINKPKVDLSLSVGVKGIDNGFLDSHEDIFDSSFPYFLGSVRVEFPFTNRENKIDLSINSIATAVVEKKIDLEEKYIQSNYRKLKYGLEKDYLSFASLEKNVELSQAILSEAIKDFNNGRIDFFTLSEFQKGQILSRQQLSSLRGQIILQTIEFADYHKFFDRHF